MSAVTVSTLDLQQCSNVLKPFRVDIGQQQLRWCSLGRSAVARHPLRHRPADAARRTCDDANHGLTACVRAGFLIRASLAT
jgi:hypothetical protein